MSKRIELDGKFYRMRRGKLVEIPREWLGQIPTKRTISNRPSKQRNKQAREVARARAGQRLDPTYQASRDAHLVD